MCEKNDYNDKIVSYDISKLNKSAIESFEELIKHSSKYAINLDICLRYLQLIHPKRYTNAILQQLYKNSIKYEPFELIRHGLTLKDLIAYYNKINQLENLNKIPDEDLVGILENEILQGTTTYETKEYWKIELYKKIKNHTKTENTILEKILTNKFKNVIDIILNDENMIALKENNQKYTIKKINNLEKNIEKEVKKLLIHNKTNHKINHKTNHKINHKAIEDYISDYISDYMIQENISLNDEQRKAIEECFKNNISIITGSAGTGKTTVIKAIKYIYDKMYPTKKNKLYIIAFTGKACMVISDTLNLSYKGHYDTTNKKDTIINENEDEQYKNYNEKVGTQIFTISRSTTIKEDDYPKLLIVDEASMIGYENMLWCLKLATFGGYHIIFLGDHKQCVPVSSVGMPFNYFINGSSIVKTQLIQVNRQSIQKLKEAIDHYVNKDILLFNDYIQHIELKNYEDMLHFLKDKILKHKDKCIILKPCHANKINNQLLNLIYIERIENKQDVQEKHNSIYYVGMPVMRKKNLYCKISKKYITVNGETGFVASYDENTITINHDKENKNKKEEKTIKVEIKDFSTDYIHNYCISIEKSQGSGYDNVYLIYNNEFYESKNKIYTAITRAKKKFVLISTNKNVLNHKKFIENIHQMNF